MRSVQAAGGTAIATPNRRYAFWAVLLGALGFVADFLAKRWALANLDPASPVQVIPGQQNLGSGHAVGKKDLVPALHELPLPHCCRSLTCRKARGFNHMPARGKRGPPSGYSAGRNKHQTARLRAPRVAGCGIARRQQIAQPRQLPGQILQHGHAQALGIGQHGAAYLDDHHPRLGKHPCAFLPPVFRRRCHICSTDRYSRV